MIQPSGDPAPSGFLVAVPAFNCEETIGEVVSGARSHAPRVIVVDDGSVDGTGSVAEAAGATVLRQPRNLGKGAAIRRALEWADAQGIATVLTMDGDGQHLPEEIPKLLEGQESDIPTLAIGARIIDEREVSANRLFGNRFANRWVEIACGETIPDTQSGMRAYPVRQTLQLGTRASRFAFETEVLIRAVRAGIPIRSVPVQTYYPPADVRRSHYRPFVDTVRIIFVVLGLIFRLY